MTRRVDPSASLSRVLAVARRCLPTYRGVCVTEAIELVRVGLRGEVSDDVYNYLVVHSVSLAGRLAASDDQFVRLVGGRLTLERAESLVGGSGDPVVCDCRHACLALKPRPLQTIVLLLALHPLWVGASDAESVHPMNHQVSERASGKRAGRSTTCLIADDAIVVSEAADDEQTATRLLGDWSDMTSPVVHRAQQLMGEQTGSRKAILALTFQFSR